MTLYNDLIKATGDGLVNMKESQDGLRIFKYSLEAVKLKAWNDVTKAARGIIFNKNGNLVAKAFNKFFNLSEMPETQIENLPNEPFTVEEKLDGSLVLAFYYEGTWRTATMQSFESEQAIKAKELLGNNLHNANTDYTYIFEVICEESRVVVRYDEEFVCLLSVFDKNGNELDREEVDDIAKSLGFRRPKIYDYKDVLNLPFFDNHEGYVLRYASGLRVKVKSPAYVRVHRLLEYVSPKRVIELIRGLDESGETVESVAEVLPPEIRNEFDDIRSMLITQHKKLIDNANSYYLQVKDLGIRKEQALWIIQNAPKEIHCLVFNLLDGKDIEEAAWKIISKYGS
jgi:RNA ligase